MSYKPLPKIVVALYDFNSSNDTELSFTQGEELKILKDDGSGWYNAWSNSQERAGLVPATYFKVDTQNHVEVVESENDEFSRRISSSPFFKFRQCLSIKFPIQCVCCSNNFFCLSSGGSIYSFDMKQKTIGHHKLTRHAGNKFRGFETMMFLRKDALGYDVFVGVTGLGDVQMFRLAWKEEGNWDLENLDFQERFLFISSSTMFLTTVGDTHVCSFYKPTYARLQAKLRIMDCSNFGNENETTDRKTMDIKLFSSDQQHLHFPAFYRRKSELVILFCKQSVQLYFLPMDPKTGLPKLKPDPPKSFLGRRKIPDSKNMDISLLSHEVLTLNKSPSPFRDQKPIYLFFKILQKKDLCIVSELPDTPNTQLLYFVDLRAHNRNIQKKVDMKYGFMSFEVLDEKFLWFPKIPANEEEMKASCDMFYKIGNLNLENMEVDDAWDLSIVIPTPFNCNFTHGMFSTMVPTRDIHGDTKVKLVIWEIGSGHQDGLWRERKEYLLEKDFQVIDFIGIRIGGNQITNIPKLFFFC